MKNVLLIVVDQWRKDCLSAAGHPSLQTPNLDSLVAKGTLFTHAYTAVPSCIAARAGLLTGLDQRRHGRVGYLDGVDWNYPVTIGSHFARHGFHTQAVGKMHVHPARALCGFHNVVLHDGYLHANRTRAPELSTADDYLPDLKRWHGADADYIAPGLGCNGYSVAPWPYDTMIHPSAWVATQSVEFLRRRDPTKPFLLMASFHRPHPPLDPPAEYLDFYRNMELPATLQGEWNCIPGVPSLKNQYSRVVNPVTLNKTGIDLARRGYYAQCTFIDHQIGRIIHALHEHRVLQDTSIVFVSDHGDMLYDHNMVAKSQPFEGSAGIPLILHPAENLRINSKQTCDAIVELRDILPTICDLAEIERPEKIDGKSIAPFCSTKSMPTQWREHLHGEHSSGAASNHWIVTDKFKYVWYSQTGIELLFDLEKDPHETHDCANECKSVTNDLRQLLIDSLTGREEKYVQNNQLVVGRIPQATLKEAGL